MKMRQLEMGSWGWEAAGGGGGGGGKVNYVV